jgi:DNA ligase-1
MKGSIENRIEMFKKAETYVGKEITVRYQELSEDGIPIFPVGLAIRDYE